MKQTTIEWLKNELNERCDIIGNENSITDIFEQAKEMEKQQKDVDYQNGYLDCYSKLMSERLTRDI